MKLEPLGVAAAERRIVAIEGANGRADPTAFSLAVARRPDRSLDPLLVRAVIEVESNGNPAAVSPAGAQGLMQLMPATSRTYGVADPFDPAQNVRGGMSLLRDLLERFGGNVRLALAAYNAGPGAVERYGGIPPFRETIAYVERVGAAYRRLSSR
ncbi:MAG: lytic transglycosylase domain-containing protein [Candidatus Eremiobacteraeota bacterium]|nr:lytic transglycosylase domain-containing protein [Candidatus Eremiobacteraeota bacterium]